MSHRAITANESVTNLVLEPQIAELYAESTEERFYEEQAERHYFEIPESSRTGQHPVLIYRIPGEELCYSFTYQRTNAHNEVHRCLGCFSAENVYTKIKVKREVEFETDPVMLPHVCIPVVWVKEKTRRVYYKKLQEWRNDATHANSTPLGEYRKLLNDINDSYDLTEEEKEEILVFLHNYGKLRRTIKRNIACHSGEAVSMLHVPDALAFHSNSAQFLQVQSSELHIYCTVETIELACRNGLGALVADGMFSMHPDVKEKNGQLYTIHGVCSDKAHMPLLHAITDRKTQATYRAIFSELEGVLARMPGGYNRELRIILDFERAAMKAAKITFPTASIEGCAFHLARAWNRKREQLGLRPHPSSTAGSRPLPRARHLGRPRPLVRGPAAPLHSYRLKDWIQQHPVTS